MRTRNSGTAWVIVATLLAVGGCKDDGARTDEGPAEEPPIRIPDGALYVLAIDQLEIDLPGKDPETEKRLRRFVRENEILVAASKARRGQLVIGFYLNPSRRTTSRYVMARGDATSKGISLGRLELELKASDGTTGAIELRDAHLAPRGKAEADGRITGGLELESQGWMHWGTGDTRWSARYKARWHGETMSDPPHATVLPPRDGLCTDAFHVRFDRPVFVRRVGEDVVLRGKGGATIQARIALGRSDLTDYATSFAVAPAGTLPFGERVGLFVKPTLQDLVGRSLDTPIHMMIKTLELPERAAEQVDFGGGSTPWRIVGEGSVVGAHRGIVASAGRLIALKPPKARQTRPYAVLVRIRVPDRPCTLRVRAVKVTRSEAARSGALELIVSAPDGRLWSRRTILEEGPTVSIAGQQAVQTRWSVTDLKMDEHRNEDVVVTLQAGPLDPRVPPHGRPTFLIDTVGIAADEAPTRR